MIKKFLNECFSPSRKPLNSEQSKERIVFYIPYLGSISFGLCNKITKHIKNTILILNYNVYIDHLNVCHLCLSISHPFCALTSSINIRVVAVMPLTMEKHLGILRSVVLST